MSLVRSFLLAVMIVWVSAAGGTCEELTLRAGLNGLVKRDVLALYDSGDEAAPDQTRIHKFLEMPLNHLGYKLTYWDLKRGVPSADLTLKHAAAVSWFGQNTIANADAYFTWATWAGRMNVKFVLFGLIGTPATPAEVPKINDFLAGLGLKFISNYVTETAATQIRTKDALVEFERKFGKLLAGYLVMHAQGPQTRIHLSTSDSSPADPSAAALGQPEAVLVATSPGGGYVAANYAIHYDQKRNRLSWLIDPIAFLSAALAGAPSPVPDTTTRAGRRIYFSHIDGDGWNNLAFPATATSAPAVTAAEAALNELIVPFPDLPVTIGLISCDADTAMGGTVGAQNVARKLYALTQVEAASHTHTHPFEWSFYENYSRKREFDRINPPIPRLSAAKPVRSAGGSISGLFDYLSPGSTAIATPALPAKVIPGPLPRYRTAKPFDLGTEVAGSLKAAQALAPQGKRPELYLWSGDTRPFEAAVRATRTAGVRNMNGGDSRYDSDFASLAYVRPLSRLVGRERQIYSVNANEMLYTNDWKGPYGGFAKLKETFERTEFPRRLKGMNLYYHMFSAEKAVSRDVVRTHLNDARAASVIPIEASRYATIADDFFQTEIRRLAPMTWRIEKRGEMQTLRFDDAVALTVDYAASAGVLGHNRHSGSLYVALDPAAAQPVLALRKVAPDASGEQAPGRTHLIESRWDVRELSVGDCAVSANAKGYGPGQMRWAGVKPGPWHIKLHQAGQAKQSFDAVADASGVLDVSLDADARSGLSLEMRCGG